tara:strand:- start:537 stop:1127 length:591 start_codon:yes stop_codon:yes gene_type:complete
MGFDLSGVNPKMNMKPEELPVYNKYSEMNFKEKWETLDKDEKLRNKYWEENDKFQKANPGIYFRNNVWWWRPLWQYVCEQFPDLISDEDAERGCYNDGHEITEDKAMKIGVELTAMLEDGRVQEHNDRYEAELKALPQVDCYVCDNNNRGYKKKKECKSCNQTGLKDDWAASYPFCVDNVREFATFCLESGGFTIC